MYAEVSYIVYILRLTGIYSCKKYNARYIWYGTVSHLIVHIYLQFPRIFYRVPAQTLSGGRTYVPCSVEGDQVVCGPLVDLYEHYMREKLSRVGIAILFSMTVFGDRCCGKCLSLLHNTVACKEEPPDLEVKNLAIKIKNAYSFMEEGNKKREVHMKSLRNSCTP